MEWQLHEGRCQDVLPAYAGQADLIITSPPYDGLRHYDGHVSDFDFAAISGLLAAALRPGGVLAWVVADAIVDGSETGTSFRQALGFIERGLRLHQTLIYEKAQALPRGTTRYGQDIAYMFVLSNGAPRVVNLVCDKAVATVGTTPAKWGMGRQVNGEKSKKSKQMTTRGEWQRRGQVWRYSVGYRHMSGGADDDALIHEHPAIFPYALAADHIRSWSNPGDLVLDPMAGSGTVLRAAVDLGRRAVGVEVNPAYCDLIRRRMAQPVLITPEA